MEQVIMPTHACSSDLYLVLDFENIPIRDYYDILLILKHSPSIVNDDIINISEEIISRMESRGIDIGCKVSIAVINNVYAMLHSIPDTSHLTNQIKSLYQYMTKSPAISPVSSPKQPKIMKKVKPYSRITGTGIPN
jgi:hypothetical protein|tara:strand:+ start:88 stop:495 length:408 start_codon:yes stop_codon:yes gene_type:complete